MSQRCILEPSTSRTTPTSLHFDVLAKFLRFVRRARDTNSQVTTGQSKTAYTKKKGDKSGIKNEMLVPTPSLLSKSRTLATVSPLAYQGFFIRPSSEILPKDCPPPLCLCSVARQPNRIIQSARHVAKARWECSLNKMLFWRAAALWSHQLAISCRPPD